MSTSPSGNEISDVKEFGWGRLSNFISEFVTHSKGFGDPSRDKEISFELFIDRN